MKDYSLTQAERMALVRYHRQVQATLALEANKLMKLQNITPSGIMLPEGGIQVNGCDIEINTGSVEDIRKRGSPAGTPPTPEEVATVKAILTVAQVFKALGANTFGPIARTDLLYEPLRGLFRPTGVKL